MLAVFYFEIDISILGALVGFGIYLFIGTKGLYGLFGIGSLVLYCGAFMQIVAGIMKMAVTFGKTAEMVPLVNYYFEIVNTNDEMTYGEKKLDLSAGFELEFKNVSFKYRNAGRSKNEVPVFSKPILSSGIIITTDITSVSAPDIKSRIIHVNCTNEEKTLS